MATSDFINSRRCLFEQSLHSTPSTTTATPTRQQQQQSAFRESRSRSEKTVHPKPNRNSIVRDSKSENCSRVPTPSSSMSSFSLNGVGTPAGSISSRRRSMSPLFTPIIGPNGHLTQAMLERNMTNPNFPQTEDECLYAFHERILWNQEKSLLPLAHDLADWLNSLLGESATRAIKFNDPITTKVSHCFIVSSCHKNKT